jgi:hypothetical protein
MQRRPGALHFPIHVTSPKTVGIITLITVVALILDTSITKVYYINFNQISVEFKVLIFLVLGMVCFFNQFLLLRYLKHKISSIFARRSIWLLYVSTYYSQVVFIVLFLVTFAEISVNNNYHTLLPILVVSASMTISSVILGCLGREFLLWFKSERDIVLLLYGLSFILLSTNIVVSGLISLSFLINKPDTIFYHLGIINPHSNLILIEALSSVNSASLIFAFVLAWISTVLMLYQFSIRWKSRIHWIILTIPLLYFFIQFQPVIFRSLLSFTGIEPVSYGFVYTLAITYSQPVGGLFFGGAFLALTKILGHKGIKFDYPVIAGYGFILIFITNQFLLLAPANYPPFGLITISLLPLASCYLFVGIYSSAIVVSKDIKLKAAIQTLVKNRSNLLVSMSTSEAINFFEKRAADLYKSIVKESRDEESSPSIPIDVAKKYVEEVLREIDNNKQVTKG